MLTSFVIRFFNFAMTGNVISDTIVLLKHCPLDPWKLGEGGDSMDQFILADNLCRLCRQKHISVENLAEAIGKSPRQVNRYRNGQCKNISIVTLKQLADALDVPLADLLREN